MTFARNVFFAGLVATAVPLGAWAQGIQYDKIELIPEKIAPNLTMLAGNKDVDPGHPDGAGGRIGVLYGPDGVLVVDSQYGQVADRVMAAIKRISTQPIRILVNTHIHIDHTGGNAAFGKAGAVIYAREELRQQMMKPAPRADGSPGLAREAAGYPTVTYGMGEPVKVHMNGETVEFIPVRAAHTGGDTMIKFTNANAIMIGDFYRNFGYPYIDTLNGGSLKGLIDALDLTMKLAGPDTKLIPGHGTLINRTDIAPYRDMIVAVRDKVRAMISQGATEQQVLAAKLTSPYDAKVAGGLLPAAGGGTSADRFVRAVYQELKRDG
jgi:glyoxylase-like metal-dependent hydrolase (beta-lactamase superfamily II)